MSQLFQPIVSEAEPVRLTPTGQVNKAASEAVGILGAEAIDAYSGYHKADLKDNLTDLSNEIINEREAPADELAPPDPEATSEANHVSRQMQHLRTAQQQGVSSESAVRIRAERILREAINRNPGLAPEFKQIAADTLGFNPLGSELNLAVQAAASRGQQNQQYTEYLWRAGTALGLPMHMLNGSAQEQAEWLHEFNRIQSDIRHINELGRQAQLTEHGTEINRRLVQERLSLQLPLVMTNIAGAMDRVLQLSTENEDGTTSTVDLTRAGHNVLSHLSTTDRAAKLAEINETERALVAEYTRDAMSAGMGVAELNALLSPVKDMFLNYRAMLDPEANLASLRAQNEFTVAAARANLLGQEGMTEVAAVLSMLSGIGDATAAQLFAKSQFFGETGGIIIRAFESTMGSNAQIPSSITEEDRSTLLNVLGSAWTNYLGDTDGARTNATPAVTNALRNSLRAMTREISGLGASTPVEISETLFEILSHPEARNLMPEIDADGEIRRALGENRGLHNYVQNIAQSMQAAIPDSVRTDERGAVSAARSITLGGLGAPTRGASVRQQPHTVMSLDVSNPQRPRFMPRDGYGNDRQVQRAVSDANRVMEARMSAVIMTFSHVYNQPYEAGLAFLINSGMAPYVDINTVQQLTETISGAQ